MQLLSLEQRTPKRHPIRKMRKLVDEALTNLDSVFNEIYADNDRPSIPPERLIRASLLQVIYSIRSERQLIEQLEYNLMFRWFVGLSVDDPVWNPSTFSKNRDRLAQAATSTGKSEVTTSILCVQIPKPCSRQKAAGWPLGPVTWAIR